LIYGAHLTGICIEKYFRRPNSGQRERAHSTFPSFIPAQGKQARQGLTYTQKSEGTFPTGMYLAGVAIPIIAIRKWTLHLLQGTRGFFENIFRIFFSFFCLRVNLL